MSENNPETQEEDSPVEIGDAASSSFDDNSLPDRSKRQYKQCYDAFIEWQKQREITSVSETTMIEYFNELAKKYKPSSLWSKYSMLKSTLQTFHNVDIGTYRRAISFLTKNAKGFLPTQSKTLQPHEVEEFLFKAPDRRYLAVKVALIFGVTGACRREELKNITVHHIQHHENMIVVTIPPLKGNASRKFMIEGHYYNIVRQYEALRPDNVKTDEFFLALRDGKCTAQVIGINNFGAMPKKIAKFLGLDQPEQYTGRSFRRTSAMMLADSGADLDTLKRHGGWKSDKAAQAYIYDSMNNYKRTCNPVRNVTYANFQSSIHSPSTLKSAGEGMEVGTSFGSFASGSSNPEVNERDNTSEVLQEDLQNYTYWKMMGGPKSFKKDACPRFFACQEGRTMPKELARLKSIEDPLDSSKNPISFINEMMDDHSEFILPDAVDPLDDNAPTILSAGKSTQTHKPDTRTKKTQTKPLIWTTRAIGVMAKPTLCEVGTCTTIETTHCKTTRNDPVEKFKDSTKTVHELSEIEDSPSTSNSVKTEQIHSFIDDWVRPTGVTAATSCDADKISPMDISQCEETQVDFDEESKDLLNISSHGFSEVLLNPCPNYSVKMETMESSFFQSTMKNLIEENPLAFIGVSKRALIAIHTFAEASGLPLEDIYLVMKKIKQNIPNEVLCHYFDKTESEIADVFARTLSSVAQFLRRFIIWPSSEDIKLKLTKALSSNYGPLGSIIDCFETHVKYVEEVNKDHPVSKKGSTKYLISITPDGMINYISRGYPGTEALKNIVESSGYLDELPSDISIVADQLMRSIKPVLQEKRCHLLRPPIILSTSESNTDHPTVSNQITCSKSYVGEVVKQLQRFKLLGRFSFVEPCLLSYLDDAMIVAVGLTNLQQQIV